MLPCPQVAFSGSEFKDVPAGNPRLTLEKLAWVRASVLASARKGRYSYFLEEFRIPTEAWPER